MLPDSPLRLEQALAHEHFLRAVARGVLGGDADVDDVLQETFLVAWREAPRHEGSLRAWLGTITRRLALDHRRSAGRRSLREGAASKSESLPSIDTIAAREETRRRLVAAVLALEEPYRTTMLWRYYEARSIPEIAQLQSVPVDTVRTRLQRALARLRTRLDAEHGGDRRAWSMLLSPLVPSLAPPSGGVAAAAAVGGGLLVKKLVAVSALLLLTLGGYAVVSRDRLPGDGSPPAPPAMAQVDPAKLVPPARETAPALAAPTRSQHASPVPEDPRRPFPVQVVTPEGTPVIGATVDTMGFDFGSDVGTLVGFGDERLATTVTGADGRCEVGDSTARRATTADVRVTADGRAVKRTTLTRGVQNRVVLDRGGLLAIRIADDVGRPVMRATLAIYEGEASIQVPGWSWGPSRPVLFEATSSDVGRFDLSLPPGAYRIRVRAPGFRPIDSDTLRIAVDDTTSWSPRLDTGIVANVHVVDELDQPVANATVRTRGPLASTATTTTDEAGRCRVPGIGLPIEGRPVFERGDNLLYFVVDAAGFARMAGSRPLPSATTDIELELRMQRGVAVRVRVVDRTGGAIPAARVYWAHPSTEGSPIATAPSESLSDGSGWIELPRILPGRRQIAIDATNDERYENKVQDIDVRPPDLETTVVLERVDGLVAGRVLRADGTAVEGGEVSLDVEGSDRHWRGRSKTAVTDADGRFRLTGLPTGKDVLLVWAKPLPKQRFPVDIRTSPSGEEAVFRLRSGGSVSGRVVDRSGAPVGAVTIRLERNMRDVAIPVGGTVRSDDFVESETTSAADGSFELFADGEDELVVRVLHGAWIPLQTNPSRARPGSRDLKLAVKPAAEGWGVPLRLLVTSGGRPYVGPLDVRWEGRSGPCVAMEEHSDGRPGRRFGVGDDRDAVDLTILATGHRPTYAKGVRLVETAEGTTIDVALDRGAVVRLRVRGNDGGPLANTKVVVNGTTVETDEVGECDSTGWPASADSFDFPVTLAADPEFTAARTPKTTAPGSTEVTLRRRGFVTARLGVEFQSLTEDVIFRLIDSKGTVVDEVRVDVTRAKGVATEARKELSLFADGTFRVTADMGSKHAEAKVEARVGRRSEVPLTLK